jgi:hypothetical protein
MLGVSSPLPIRLYLGYSAQIRSFSFSFSVYSLRLIDYTNHCSSIFAMWRHTKWYSNHSRPTKSCIAMKYMHACIFVCRQCMYVCMQAVYVCMQYMSALYMYVVLYVCMHACMLLRIYVCIYDGPTHMFILHACREACICVYVCVGHMLCSHYSSYFLTPLIYKGYVVICYSLGVQFITN